MQTQYTKQTMKQKIKAELKIAAATLTAAAAIGTMGLIAHTACTYMTPIRTETKDISSCTIVSSTYGSDFPTVDYLTPQGELRTASLPAELERTVAQKLIVEHKSIPATMKESVSTYKTLFGMSSYTNASIKSLEETK